MAQSERSDGLQIAVPELFVVRNIATAYTSGLNGDLEFVRCRL